MLYFHRANLVYLATPKTGTTAIETAFGDHASVVLKGFPQIKHTTWRKYNRFLRPYLETYAEVTPETVAVFREPISWLASWYRYRQRDAIEGTKNSTKGLSFDQFVQGYLADDQPPFAHVGSQARFVSDGTGKVQVSHLYRYEALTECANFIADCIGVTVDLPKLNVSKPAQIELSKVNRTALAQKFSADFDIYESLG